MFEKIKQLSELPAFNGGTAEHVLFVLVIVVFLTLFTITIVLVARYAVKGIQEMWSRLCDVRQSAINAKTKIEEQYTLQIQSKGKTSKQFQN
jgi:hypothetical protein